MLFVAGVSRVRQSSICFFFNLSQTCNTEEQVLMLAGNLWDARLLVCVVTITACSAPLLHPSHPNAMSSRPISSRPARPRCSFGPLIILFAAMHARSANKWVCDHIWSHCLSRQESSHEVPYFLLDTWGGVRRCWLIHGINSCTNSLSGLKAGLWRPNKREMCF